MCRVLSHTCHESKHSAAVDLRAVTTVEQILPRLHSKLPEHRRSRGGSSACLAHDGMQREPTSPPTEPQTRPGIWCGGGRSCIRFGRRGGRRVINPGLSGRRRIISKAFLDSGGQQIFQKTRRHGCQYVFIAIDGMRIQSAAN
jgi:hypothetical protein